jgi:hypothetical protein
VRVRPASETVVLLARGNDCGSRISKVRHEDRQIGAASSNDRRILRHALTCYGYDPEHRQTHRETDEFQRDGNVNDAWVCPNFSRPWQLNLQQTHLSRSGSAWVDGRNSDLRPLRTCTRRTSRASVRDDAGTPSSRPSGLWSPRSTAASSRPLECCRTSLEHPPAP